MKAQSIYIHIYTYIHESIWIDFSTWDVSNSCFDDMNVYECLTCLYEMPLRDMNPWYD